MSAEEAIRLSDYVAALVQKQAMEIKVQRRAEAMLNAPCVHCGFSALVRNGKTGAGVPRFYCRICKATSSATTNTVIAKVRKRSDFVKYLDLMSQHHSIAFLKEHHFPYLAPMTLLRWRHRIMEQFVANKDGLTGLVQADETHFALSFKGFKGYPKKAGYRPRKRGGLDVRGISNRQIKVLTAVADNGINQEQLANHGAKTFVQAMTDWLAKSVDTVLVTDGHKAFPQVASLANCLHIQVKPKTSQNGINLSQVNGYHNQLKSLINARCLAFPQPT